MSDVAMQLMALFLVALTTRLAPGRPGHLSDVRLGQVMWFIIATLLLWLDVGCVGAVAGLARRMVGMGLFVAALTFGLTVAATVVAGRMGAVFVEASSQIRFLRIVFLHRNSSLSDKVR